MLSLDLAEHFSQTFFFTFSFSLEKYTLSSQGWRTLSYQSNQLPWIWLRQYQSVPKAFSFKNKKVNRAKRKKAEEKVQAHRKRIQAFRKQTSLGSIAVIFYKLESLDLIRLDLYFDQH